MAIAPPPSLGSRALWSRAGDETLARRAAAGNDAAFTALYERYHGPLLGYCRSILLDSEDARDATQSALESALRALPTRDAGRPLRPWLYRIAHNEAVTILRRRRSHDELGPDNEPAVCGPEVHAEQRGRLEQLVEDLRSLPERQRGALVMRELNGLSYEEIGGALGLTEGNARRAVFDARSALHDVADGHDADCVAIRRSLSDGDRRSMRARSIRAHLRSCDQCRTFHSAIRARRADLPAIAPWLGGVAAAGMLGLGALPAGGGGALIAAGGGGVSWSALPAAAKGLALAAVVATTGTAATLEIAHDPPPSRERAAARQAERPSAPSERRVEVLAATAAQAAARRARQVRRAAAADRRTDAGGHGAVALATHDDRPAHAPKPVTVAQTTKKPTPPAAPAPVSAPPPASVSGPPEQAKTPGQTVKDKLEQLQAQIQAAIAKVQAAAAAGTAGALAHACELVAGTMGSVQAMIGSALSAVGIRLPPSLASAPTGPASASAASLTTAAEQMLAGIQALLGQLRGAP